MTYTLILLGTDTQYSPNKVDNAYDKAETLSYLASLIPGTNLADPDEVTKLRHENIAVVDGPTTLGTEVGDRIARGVEAILEAISRGETKITIAAHSRGGVEAILVAHEIERIQKLFKDPSFTWNKITESVCPYTKTAMEGKHKPAFEKLNLAEIKKNIDAAKLFVFDIDPVPGGNYFGFTRASNLAWTDSRMYTLPEIIVEYEQYIYKNERTRCFKPITPQCASPNTKFTLQALPGHHGTGSGNLRDQQRKEFPSSIKNANVEHVQELVLVKLIDFLTRNGVKLTPRTPDNDPFHHIIKELQSEEEHNTILYNPENLPPLYYNLYEQIALNKAAYEYFNKTSYAVLGREQSLLKKVGMATNDRIVHYHDHNDTFLETFLPPVPGKHFLNYEHAQLYLKEQLNIDKTTPLDKIIDQSVKNLIRIGEHDKNLTTGEENLSSSTREDKFAVVASTDEGFKLIKQAIGLLVEEIREAFLHNTPFSEEVSKAVEKAFSEFKTISQDNTVVKSTLEYLNENLTNTLEEKSKALLKRCDSLSIDKSYLSEWRNNLRELKSKLELNNIPLLNLDALIIEVNNLDNADSSVDKILTFLRERSQKFLEDSNDTLLLKTAKEEICTGLQECYDYYIQYDTPNLLRKASALHNELVRLREAIPYFKGLYEKACEDNLETILLRKQEEIVNLTAHHISEKNINLDSIASLFKDNPSLYESTKAKAPKIEDSLRMKTKEEIPAIETEFRLLKEEHDRLIEDYAGISLEYKALTEKRVLEAKNFETLKAENVSLKVKNAMLQDFCQNSINQTKIADGIIEKLHTPEEKYCQRIIDDKLLPLTQRYLTSLAEKVRKTLQLDSNSTLSISELINKAAEETWPKDNSSSILRKKFTLIYKLSVILCFTKDHPLPSARLAEYCHEVNEAKQLLKQHRSPDWQRYLTNVAAVFAIAITVGLPLIIVKLMGKSLKFWESSGQTYLSSAEAETNTMEKNHQKDL